MYLHKGEKRLSIMRWERTKTETPKNCRNCRHSELSHLPGGFRGTGCLKVNCRCQKMVWPQ